MMSKYRVEYASGKGQKMIQGFDDFNIAFKYYIENISLWTDSNWAKTAYKVAKILEYNSETERYEEIK